MPKKHTKNTITLLSELDMIHYYFFSQLVKLNMTDGENESERKISDWNAITLLFRFLTSDEKVFRVFLYLFLAQPNKINNFEDFWQTIKLRSAYKISLEKLQRFFHYHTKNVSINFSDILLDFSILPVTTDGQISRAKLALEIIKRLISENTILLPSIDAQKARRIKEEIIKEAYSFLEKNQLLNDAYYQVRGTLPLCTDRQKALLFCLTEMNKLNGKVQDWKSLTQLFQLLLANEEAFLIFNSIYNQEKMDSQEKKIDFKELFLQMQRDPRQGIFSHKTLKTYYSDSQKYPSMFNAAILYEFSLDTSKLPEVKGNPVQLILKKIKEVIKNEIIEEEITHEEIALLQEEIVIAKEKVGSQEDILISPEEIIDSAHTFSMSERIEEPTIENAPIIEEVASLQEIVITKEKVGSQEDIVISPEEIVESPYIFSMSERSEEPTIENAPMMEELLTKPEETEASLSQREVMQLVIKSLLNVDAVQFCLKLQLRDYLNRVGLNLIGQIAQNNQSANDLGGVGHQQLTLKNSYPANSFFTNNQNASKLTLAEQSAILFPFLSNKISVKAQTSEGQLVKHQKVEHNGPA